MIYIGNKRYNIKSIYPDSNNDFDATFKFFSWMKSFNKRQCVTGALAVASIVVAGSYIKNPYLIGASIVSIFAYNKFVKECQRLKCYSEETKLLFDFEAQYKVYKTTERFIANLESIEKLKNVSIGEKTYNMLEAKEIKMVRRFFDYLSDVKIALKVNRSRYEMEINQVNIDYKDGTLDPTDADYAREANINMLLRCDRDSAYVDKLVAENLELFSDLCTEMQKMDIYKHLKSFIIDERIAIIVNDFGNLVLDEDARLRKFNRIHNNYIEDDHFIFSDSIKKEEINNVSSPSIIKAEKYLEKRSK